MLSHDRRVSVTWGSFNTDGRGVVATYTYDAMNRTTGISFDDGSSTETVTYGYDPQRQHDQPHQQRRQHRQLRL